MEIDKVIKILFKTLSFFLCLFLWACTINISRFGDELPSIGDSYSPSDSDTLYVDLDINAYQSQNLVVPFYELNTTETYGPSQFRDSVSNCEIEYVAEYSNDEDNRKERKATQTIICILDIPEFEFIAKDFYITYNFPEGMCEYSHVALPWHFNYPLKPGPWVTRCTCTLPAEEPDSDPTQEERYCDLYNMPTDSDCDNQRFKKEADELCEGFPKCCFGGQRLVEEGAASRPGNPENKWEPERICFGGPERIAATFRDAPFHAQVTALPKGGLRRTIHLPSMLSYVSSTYTSAPYANYLQALDIFPKDLPPNIDRSGFPLFLQNPILRNSMDSETPPRELYRFKHYPRLFFEFSCLDSAKEVVHQALVLVREWNDMKNFIAFLDAGGTDDISEANPDTAGLEGNTCEYEPTRLANTRLCNDLLDFDDFVSGADSRLEQFPSLVGLVNFAGYPRVEYEGEQSGI